MQGFMWRTDIKVCLFSFRQQDGDSVHTGAKMEKRRGRQGTGSFPGEGYKKAVRYNQNIENGRGAVTEEYAVLIINNRNGKGGRKMDEDAKKIMDRLARAEIGLDDEFKFHCTQCGNCCRNREDILLNPRDVYHMAKELKMAPKELTDKYCEVYIGDDSRMPIVRMQSRGLAKRCPMLKYGKCIIHNAKPTVCAMFPIGRYITTKAGEAATGIGAGTIRYIFNNPGCGDDLETHTVREWLKDFGIPEQDEFFMKWQETIAGLVNILPKMEKSGDGETMDIIWATVLAGLYLQYDTEKDFMPQFEKNVEDVFDALQKAGAGKGGKGR